MICTSVRLRLDGSSHIFNTDLAPFLCENSQVNIKRKKLKINIRVLRELHSSSASLINPLTEVHDKLCLSTHLSRTPENKGKFFGVSGI